MPSRVLLVVIDAATPHVVCPAIRTGRLPVLQRLADAGAMHEASVSIFPSITPAATSSIATGTYPAEHGIAGASWYDSARDEIAYYGDDFWVIAREGFGNFVSDFLLRLNGDRLKAPTLFQMLERTGRTAACLNYLVFKGDRPHDIRVPAAMAALPGVPLTATVQGPTVLNLGDFVGSRLDSGRKVDRKAGLLHRFGMDDDSTGAMLRDLMGTTGLPDFTIAYFADNDYQSHVVGPVAALPVLDRIDVMLGEAFEAAGGLDRVLEDTVVIVTSDHGHCDILADGARAVVRLDAVLADFRQAQLGRPWHGRDEIMICPNMRAAQIYVREPNPGNIERIAAALLADARVDQVMWRSHLTMPGSGGYTVRSGRGRLDFAHGAMPDRRDGAGSPWTWTGDAETLGLVQDGGAILFPEYPNAFERIANVLDLEQSGEIWVTARPGCEFEVPGGKAHVGGASHGALHKLDSLSPVIVAGGGVRQRLPREMRLVDIAPLCMQLLGVPMRYRVGDARSGSTSAPARP